jgi:acyl-CoA synthetase (AMP-forming)/AMP-acid ligase II
MMVPDAKVIGDALKYYGRETPEKTALIFKGETYSFRRLMDMSCRLANALQHHGVGKGDKVALLIHNVPEFTICYFAVAILGAVLVPINVRFRSSEIRYVADQSDSVAILLTAQFFDEYEAVRKDLEKIRTSILIPRVMEGVGNGRLEEVLGKSAGKYHRYTEWLETFPSDWPDVEVLPEDEHAIWYTSGTTGFPKGAVITHGSTMFATKSVMESHAMSGDEVVLMVLPLFHNGYQMVCFTTHLAGATLNIMESFSTKALLEEMQKNRATTFFSVPAILNLLLHYPDVDTFDLSSLRKLIYGASLSTEETIRKIHDRFHCKIYHAYGQSEYCPGIAVLRDEDSLAKFGSIGTPLNNEIAIMEENDRMLPPGEAGEICVRGKGMMKGYYNKPQETAKTIRNGWLHTSDMGFMDEDGYLFFLGRKDDMIDRGGENIHPKDVEEVLSTHPKVREVVVIGVPDSIMSSAVKAYVILKEGMECSPEEIRQYCKGKMADYKVPRYLEVCGEFPMNASGKVVKMILRQKELERYKELGAKIYEKLD